MKKITKAMILGLTLLSLLVFSACESTQITEKSSGQLLIVSNDIDLKEIPIFGGKVNADFIVRNDSPETVVILDAETSCMCTEATIKGKDGFESGKIVMKRHGATKPINYNLESGGEITVTAVFDPLAHGPDATGPIMRDVYLHTNSEAEPTMKLTFQGNVIKQL